MSWLSSFLNRKPLPRLWTGKVYTANEFRAALGTWDSPADSSYAEINEDSLSEYYDWYKAKLFDLGLLKWDPKSDCDNFANLYTDLFQLRFYLAQWERGTLPDAESVAVASYWYKPQDSITAHAINAVLTNNGLRFIEPQTGKQLELTLTEKASMFRCIF